MLKILTNTPFFVWPLFAVLLIGGFKARKASTVSLNTLLLIPGFFFVWSFFSFFKKSSSDPLTIFLWFFCLAIGIFIGFLQMKRLHLQFDVEKRNVEMPGSWIPLILSMLIFAAKFSLGMTRSMFPHLDGSMLFLGLELFSTLILGIFQGRVICCFYRYEVSKKLS